MIVVVSGSVPTHSNADLLFYAAFLSFHILFARLGQIVQHWHKGYFFFSCLMQHEAIEMVPAHGPGCKYFLC